MKKVFAVGLITASLIAGGCATSPNNTQKGAGIGAVVGALLGKATGDNDKSRYAWGAVVGAIAGGAIGNYMDRQEEEMREQLADTGVQVVREGDNLRLIMPGDITFATNSASISPNFNPVLQDVATVVNQYEKTVLLIEGHTDDTGAESYNQTLSERRAQSVKNLLTTFNVNPTRVTTVGLGEYQPKVPNTSAENRQINRRVELKIQPVTQSNSR
ncbi:MULTISPECIES: OmpA family protein [unclassified Alteromonas]|uniref:OmpA family protein n=1 Tax=unclassified Alteromonas TaxID=2614992 RepID=UPI000E68AE2F|nr:MULTISPECIES: OmpA family protein [unclassified Alteromonas]AYA66363.1 OmpA family protein [Alteromonas sp. RKMC-009]MDO6474386.1 OmpA family protein [Alteromonas sp. 1_MG-2023]